MINQLVLYQMAHNQIERLREAATRQRLLKAHTTPSATPSRLRQWTFYLLSLIYAKAMIVTAGEINRLQSE